MTDMLLGKKLSMTQIWDAEGVCYPVTVIQAGPCQVVQVKKAEGKDGYDAVQIAFDPLPARKNGQGTARATKPLLGHFKRHNAEPHRLLQEFRVHGDGKKKPTLPEPGAVLNVGEVFKDVKKVDVSGTSKGRGFQGCIRRHKFNAGRRSHGSKNYREPGSIGQNQSPGHVIKGKRMPGQMGNVQRTVRNLDVVKIEGEQNLLYVRGAVPGPRNGYVVVRKAVRS